MDTRTLTRIKPTALPTSHVMYFAPGELTLIEGRSDPALAPGFQAMMSEKVVGAILHHHPGREAEHVTVTSLNARDKVLWGIPIEVRYRVHGQRGYYRHAFHLIMQYGEQSGRLYTQMRRSIAK